MEAINTVTEKIVDFVSATYSTAARDAQDLGSFVVFCMCCWCHLLLPCIDNESVVMG
ncbi:diacylglycerol kinase [Ochrobactrum sp. BTU1]|uniref:diacylglycerol kinase n=1 Tax=Ochrobactrum sp. BTU1 TaxID=2840456 RepID=UPI00207B8C23